MNNWWAGLNIRERIIVAVAGLIITVIAIDSLVLQPMSSSSENMDEKIVQARNDLEWMRSAVNRLPERSNQTKRNTDRIVSYIDKQISRQGLKKNLEQMTPIQNNSARLRMSNVDFTKLLSFFSVIDGAVFIDEVRLIPGESPGLVNVSLVISNGTDA